MKFFSYKSTRNSKEEKANKILNYVKKNNVESFKVIQEAVKFYEGLLEFATGKTTPEVLIKDSRKALILPLRKYLDPVLPKGPKPDPTYHPYDTNPIFIVKYTSISRYSYIIVWIPNS